MDLLTRLCVFMPATEASESTPAPRVSTLETDKNGGRRVFSLTSSSEPRETQRRILPEVRATNQTREARDQSILCCDGDENKAGIQKCGANLDLQYLD